MSYPKKVAIFLGILATAVMLVITGMVIWDIYLIRTGPEGNSISWAMARWGYRNPFWVLILGIALGDLHMLAIGLGMHFWWGMPDPADVEKMEILRARVRELEGKPGITPTGMHEGP